MTISRRVFLGTATASLPASRLSAEEDTPQDAGFHTAEHSVSVDDYGAVGDCPRSGSTSAGTDDTDAIRMALLACADGGIVRFSPGKVYLVSAPIDGTGKSLTLDLRGAVIRIADDTVWHVFTFGGARDQTVDFVHVIGGVLDGNLQFQRYYPNTAGSKIFTDKGLETYGAHRGTPFYSNSRINGETWHPGWIDGSHSDGVNVNGRGNRGLIRIQYARDASFENLTIRDFVRDGLVTWNCRNSSFLGIEGSGQLPTHFHELNELFGLRHEAAYMKVSGSNPDAVALGTHGEQNVIVRGGRTTGGVMPIFCRTNQPKSEAPANRAIVEGFSAYGFCRDVWFEVVNEVRITNCHLLGVDIPGATARGRAGIFLSNNTRHWSIRDSILRGHIDTRQRQNATIGMLDGVDLTATGLTDDWIVNCHIIRDSIIRSNGRGALCDVADNVTAQAEHEASLSVRRAMVNCSIGGERYETTQHLLAMDPGSDTVPVSGLKTAHSVRVDRRNMNVQGGRWFALHHADYSVAEGQLVFDRKASVGDEIRVTIVPVLRQHSMVNGPNPQIILEAPGADFPQDVLSVELAGTEVQPASSAAPDAPAFRVGKTASGVSVVSLDNISTRIEASAVVHYLPPRRPYAGFRLGNGDGGLPAACTGVTATNTTSCVLDGDVTVSGDFQQVSDRSAFIGTQGSKLKLHGVCLSDCTGGVLSMIRNRASARRIEIENSSFEGWGRHSAETAAPPAVLPSTSRRNPIASELLKVTNSTFVVPTGAPTASMGPLPRRNSVNVIVGLNAFLGFAPGRGWD